MIITFAGTLFAAITMIACASVFLTIMHYGARVSQLRRELVDSPDFIEMRVVQRPVMALPARVALRGAPRPVLVPVPVPVPAARRVAA